MSDVPKPFFKFFFINLDRLCSVPPEKTGESLDFEFEKNVMTNGNKNFSGIDDKLN